MDDQLDNDLKNRIREVFDNFEDPAADEGWLLLRQKFPVQQKQPRPLWFWWASAAAAVLLFLGIGLYTITTKNNNQTFTAKPAKPHQQITYTDSAKQLAANATGNDSKTVTKSSSVASVNSSSAQQTKLANNDKTIRPNAGQPAVISASKNISSTQLPAFDKPEGETKSSTTEPDIKTFDNTLNQTQQLANNSVAVRSPGKTDVDITNNTDTQTATIAKIKPKTSAGSMDALLASDIQQSKKTEKTAIDKKVRFSVYAATYFNYAKGSDNQVNAGAGFTSDISISKNLKLSTGVAFAQNKMNFNKSTPINDRIAESTPALAVSYQTESSFAKASGTPVFKNYNASLAGLEIPINLKYEFNPGKSDTYISAGLSSGTFINEAYTASYSYPSLAKAAGVEQQTTDETTRNSFNSFYFGKTLNLAFGIGYPLGKSNRLIIEPFLKYPLDGMGAQQIKFGAGGLNLKFNFTGKR